MNHSSHIRPSVGLCRLFARVPIQWQLYCSHSTAAGGHNLVLEINTSIDFERESLPLHVAKHPKNG